MRNLSKHPITFDEMHQTLLREAQKAEDEGKYGDMRPAVFREISARLKRLQFAADRR